MARKFGFLFLGVCLVIGALGFMGCDTGNEETGILTGIWSSGTDGYVITTTTLEYKGYKDATHPEWSDYSFTGTIKNNPDFTQKAGVIIVEYTDKPIYGTYNNDYTELTSGAAPTNSFMGIYWRDLTANSVLLANAYDQTDQETEQATLVAANTKFTLANADTLVTWAGVQPQKK
ncbi:MAG: hypothetical protein LBJ41_04905 [Treponema sp.]|jgi:hypothetical protein|nr:hypothetical protein [Treponema sp.]